MEKTQAMQAWNTELNDRTDNNEEREELEDDAELSDERGVPMDAFVTRRDVIAMIADGTMKAAAAKGMLLIKNTV